MRTPKLTDDELQKALTELDGWSLDEGMLKKTFAFTDFIGSVQFVTGLAFKAEIAEHHPDLDIRYNKVLVGLVTHDSGGITEKDVALAKEADALAG
ncbi:MAG: 4a-hydroxytetrahydrobiopterin dehydratase [Armatimonadaceae bacterium]